MTKQALQGEIDRLQAQRTSVVQQAQALQTSLTEINAKLSTAQTELNKLALRAGPRVTDHAVLRYLERVLNIDIAATRKIIEESLDRLQYVEKENTIVTILGEKE